ncbi:hypothetical protein DYD21_00460 [Rhodohalobacter sp. SW132]|nr:hypothetical protein DYD21_00460 [Rhodohalobacter sp. SW132]
MEKKTDHIFRYPPNLQELDLATMVTLYRERGEVHRAKPGSYLACAASRKLIREAKEWFGLYYSQESWDSMLTKGSNGYPLTEAELNALGLIFSSSDDPPHREYVEKHIGTIPKLAYLILNDLKQFGFLAEDESGFLSATPQGERALQSLAKRIYGKPFSTRMLVLHQTEKQESGTRGKVKQNDDQTSLF